MYPYRLRTVLVLLALLCTLAPAIGQQSPRYTIYDSLTQLQARIQQAGDHTTLIINFWATWCKPCVEELAWFEKLNEQYGGDKKVQVLLVSLDFKSQLKQRLDKYLNDHPIPNLEIVVLADQDADSWVPRVTSDWDGSLPFTMVLNKGVIKDTHRQEFQSFDDLVKFVAPHVPPKPTLASKRRR